MILKFKHHRQVSADICHDVMGPAQIKEWYKCLKHGRTLVKSEARSNSPISQNNPRNCSRRGNKHRIRAFQNPPIKKKCCKIRPNWSLELAWNWPQTLQASKKTHGKNLFSKETASSCNFNHPRKKKTTSTVSVQVWFAELLQVSVPRTQKTTMIGYQTLQN